MSVASFSFSSTSNAAAFILLCCNACIRAAVSVIFPRHVVRKYGGCLKELKNAGLIQGTIEGTSVCYCIDPKVWKQLKTSLDSFFVSYNNNEKCC